MFNSTVLDENRHISTFYSKVYFESKNVSGHVSDTNFCKANTNAYELQMETLVIKKPIDSFDIIQ